MRTARSRAERMAAMRPRFADLALTSAGVVLGLLTLALQRSAADGTWREIDALAIALVLLMALPAATCRRAPIASAVTARGWGRCGPRARRGWPRWRLRAAPRPSVIRRRRDGSQRC